MYLDTYVRTHVRTYADLKPFFFFLRYTICCSFGVYCYLSVFFICFAPEVIFRSTVIGACPVTADCIVAMMLIMWKKQHIRPGNCLLAKASHQNPVTSQKALHRARSMNCFRKAWELAAVLLVAEYPCTWAKVPTTNLSTLALRIEKKKVIPPCLYLRCDFEVVQFFDFATSQFCDFTKKKSKNVSCEYGRWVVETQLCKLRDTSDTLVGRACAMFQLKYGACELHLRYGCWYVPQVLW